MALLTELSDEDCTKLSKKILKDIYSPAFSFKRTIFLCGADISQKNKMRFKIADALNKSVHSFFYDIVYPEDIFEELLFSSKSKDLLSLEGLLAESVDAIVLIPESPGSFTELGAFAKDEQLRNKLICVLKKRYKKKKSFINQGPLKLVKKANKEGVLFVNPDDIPGEITRLHTALGKIKKRSSKKSDTLSILQLDNFILPSIFLLEPAPKKVLIKLVEAATDDYENAFQTTTAVLTILTKKKQIELTTKGYKLTEAGLENFFEFIKTGYRKKSHYEKIEMDNLRLEVMNLKYRKKRLSV